MNLSQPNAIETLLQLFSQLQYPSTIEQLVKIIDWTKIEKLITEAEYINYDQGLQRLKVLIIYLHVALADISNYRDVGVDVYNDSEVLESNGYHLHLMDGGDSDFLDYFGELIRRANIFSNSSWNQNNMQDLLFLGILLNLARIVED